MKPKYQDTVKDYRPTIPLKSIKQKYTPTQSYVSQDNRSNWQHEQDAEMADRAYKQQMEDRKMQEGLHNLNGFLTFTDYAGLATGVGGLVSKGLKWGGKQVAKRIVRNKNLGIVAKPFQNSSFKSSLDWSPKAWFKEAGKWKDYNKEDIKALNSHLEEYLQIEKTTKANGTWLTTPNGSKWSGDPRSWVQLMSMDGRKMKMPNSNYKVGIKGSETIKASTYNGRSWMSNNPEVYNSFANKKGHAYYTPIVKEGETYQLTIPKDSKIARVNAQGKDFENIEFNNRKMTTDQIVDLSKRNKYDATSIENVIEGPHYRTKTISNDLVIHEGTPRKSILGNNGNFNLNDKNIYRGFIPLGILGGMNYGRK